MPGVRHGAGGDGVRWLGVVAIRRSSPRTPSSGETMGMGHTAEGLVVGDPEATNHAGSFVGETCR